MQNNVIATRRCLQCDVRENADSRHDICIRRPWKQQSGCIWRFLQFWMRYLPPLRLCDGWRMQVYLPRTLGDGDEALGHHHINI
jgi:hypothetical protein